MNELEFSKKYVALFQEVFMRTYQKKRADTLKETNNVNQNVVEIETQQSNIAEKILELNSKVMIKKLEEKFEELKEARKLRAKAEIAEDTAKEYLKYASHLIEHAKELLIDQANLHRQEAMFDLVFKNLPTYTEMLNRTVDLHPLFKLKRDSVSTKSRMVTLMTLSLNHC